MSSPFGLWPRITDLESAKAATRSSWRMTAFLALVVGIGALLSFTGHGYANIKGWGLVQAAILAGTAYGIATYARGAAIFGFVFASIEAAWIGLERGVGDLKGPLILLVVLTSFLSGVRGTFAYHRYRVREEEAERPENLVYVVSLAALLGLVIGFLSYVGRTQLYACSFLNPTPRACDRFGWGGDSPETRVRRANDAFNQWVNENPTVKEWWRDHGNPSTIRAITVRGMRRLSYNELREWNRIRLALASVSPAVCEMLWTGVLEETTVTKALGSLPQADIDSWYRLLYVAAERQIPAGLAAPPHLTEDDAAAEEGLAFIIDSMEPQVRETFRAQIARAAELRGAEACAAFKTVFTGVERMPWGLGTRFMRASATAVEQ